MKTKLKILVVACVVLLLALVFWTLGHWEKDPVYGGKPLSMHLLSCKVGGIHTGGGYPFLIEEPPAPGLGNVQLGPAGEPILAVGTNAFPMLVRMLGGGETMADRCFRMIIEKCGLSKRFPRTNDTATWLNITRALAAFHTLGPRAAPAADRIVPLLDNPDTALQAIVALMLIHPGRDDQILSLTNVGRIRRTARTGATPTLLFSSALLALGSFGPRASGAIPVLMDSLSSTNKSIQAAAAVALARVGAPAAKVIPLILKSMPKTDPMPPAPQRVFPRMIMGPDYYVLEVMMKIWALEQYGPEARTALPMLETFEQWRSGNIKEAAKRAKARINGEAYRPASIP